MSVGARSDGSFDETFFEELMGRFSQLRSSQEVGSFGGPFSPSELRRALGVCVDSAMGLDGVPYSLFKVPFPWWQRALLNLFNLVLSWGVVPTLWKRSIVVPVFKRRDAGLATNCRPSLVRRVA